MSKILVICFFPAFRPASSGGELRLGKLYRAVGRVHEVTILTSSDFGSRFEEIVHTQGLREVRFPKDELWRNAYSTLEKSGLHGDLSGLAFAMAVSHPECKLRQLAAQLAQSSDFVIHEFPYSEPIFSSGCPCPEIYNSHNFEASLLSAIASGEGFESALLKLIRLEGNLVGRAQKVFSTSRADENKFRLFYGVNQKKLAVCPNGFDESDLRLVMEKRTRRHIQTGRDARPRLLFLGSSHQPNVEAAVFLLVLAHEMPHCDFVLAGGLCGALSKANISTNVILYGPFTDSERIDLLVEADLFLNPVVLGSGTSLKALEALAAALPMVSTEEGVRGLGLTALVHCYIVTREKFQETIEIALSNRAGSIEVAENGRDIAYEKFTWKSIADNFVSSLVQPIVGHVEEERLVLALNDYSVMQPGSGGIARVRNVLANLDSDILLISFGDDFEVGFVADSVLHVTVPKTLAHLNFELAVNDGEAMSANDVVASLFVLANRLFVQLLSGFATRCAAAIFEHPYLAPVIDIFENLGSKFPIIYSAHNVEATHKATIFRGHRLRDTLVEYIVKLEAQLTQRADLIVSCTQTDADVFYRESASAIVVANGCAVPIFPDETTDVSSSLKIAKRNRVGFMGSAHGPNVEAARFIIDQLVPYFPDITFEFIGSVCEALADDLPINVTLHGAVSDFTKTTILRTWTIALNPILTGGGSSLKLPDFLSHGLATISTPAGARSFAIVEHGAGLIVDRERFQSSILDMMNDPQLLEQFGMNAYRYAKEKLDWSAITSAYRESLRSLIQEATNPSVQTRKLLVITYRYTEPPLGGAEEYLIEVLKRLRPRFEKIDLATVDVDGITNLHHFGCRVSALNGGPTLRVGELFDNAMYFPCAINADTKILEQSRDIERAWCKEEFPLFVNFLSELSEKNRLRIFAGFFWPENHDGLIRRWTSSEFSFLVPASARTFQMTGYAAQAKTLSLSLLEVVSDGVMERKAMFEMEIAANFRVNISLPRLKTLKHAILIFEVQEHHAPGDHRPFGLLLDSASVLMDPSGEWNDDEQSIRSLSISVADLSEQHDEYLRTNLFRKWVDSLKRIAINRSAAMEAKFAEVRGPHSPLLQEWIAKNAGTYDSILVQGIPFDLIPRTVETLSAIPLRSQLVTLPHFHGDDRFYYWRRYLDAFRLSDANLLFSSSIAERIGADCKCVVVPGGGVRADEYADISAHHRFREVHAHSIPFFLVLGRKTPSKGYQSIIRAQQELRKLGMPIDLVMIGPDEDGAVVSGAGVHYLGRQPRSVVRGALSACLGLVTMSNSESFGIVICEAWLFGKSVIANRACYSFRELIDDGVTGCLVSTDEELVASMRRFIYDPRARDRMGRRGFETAIQQFSWDIVASRLSSALARREIPIDSSPLTTSIA